MKTKFILSGINNKSFQVRQFDTLEEVVDVVNCFMTGNKYDADTLRARVVSWCGQSNTGYDLPTNDPNVRFKVIISRT